MQATDESAYLREVCRIVVEDCDHAMVWIGYAEEDEGKTGPWPMPVSRKATSKR